MASRNIEEELHISRYIIFYKFILGLLETLLGLGIIFFGNQFFSKYQEFKTQELLEDPHDLLVLITEKIIPLVLEHRGYVVFLLLLLGVVKLVGAVGLWYHKHWGLDLLIILTIALLPFQTFSLVVNPSLYKFIYFTINLFIALYLVQFKPRQYFWRVHRKIKAKLD